MIGNPDTKQQKTCKATFISNHQELSHEKEYFNGVKVILILKD